MHTIQAALALFLVAALPAPGAQIAWQTSYDAALKSAKAENKVLFIAVNMDGEGANDRMAKNVYDDKSITALSAATVNLIASPGQHGTDPKSCLRFDGLTCAEHQAVEKSVRATVLKPDPSGNVVAPQHVFVDGDGRPLLSVPFEISSSELEWCFVTAMRRADPSKKIAMPQGAHMPRMVVLGAVYDPTGAVGGAIQPLTKAELAELIKSVKKGLEFEERQAAFWRILHSDSADAFSFIKAELRTGGSSETRPGADGSGGGPSAGGNPMGSSGKDKHARILHAMGAVSPSSYWELAVDFLDANDDILRLEAAVALEQMRAPEAVKALQKALNKEKKPEIEKDMVRALASCGGTDTKVRAGIIKRARTEKDELVRINAILALGLMEPDADVRACIQEHLDGKDETRQAIAAIAAALTLDDSWIPALEPLATAPTAVLSDAATRALEILRGGPLKRLEMPVWTICKDQVLREKTFGKAQN